MKVTIKFTASRKNKFKECRPFVERRLVINTNLKQMLWKYRFKHQKEDVSDY